LVGLQRGNTIGIVSFLPAFQERKREEKESLSNVPVSRRSVAPPPSQAAKKERETYRQREIMSVVDPKKEKVRDVRVRICPCVGLAGSLRIFVLFLSSEEGVPTLLIPRKANAKHLSFFSLLFLSSFFPLLSPCSFFFVYTIYASLLFSCPSCFFLRTERRFDRDPWGG